MLGTYYVMTFYRNCRNEGSINSLQKYLSAVTTLVLLQACSLSTLPVERALFITGLISSFCSFMAATSVLVTLPSVIRSKNSSSIPGAYAVANLGASMVWSLCGYILEDPCVLIPNLFATLCSAISLTLKVQFPSDANMDLDSVELEEGKPTKEPKEVFYPPVKRPLNAEKPCSLHNYLSLPPEYIPVKPASSKMDWMTLDKHVENIKGSGQKFLAAAAPAGQKILAVAVGLPPKILRWEGDGTGGTF